MTVSRLLVLAMAVTVSMAAVSGFVAEAEQTIAPSRVSIDQTTRLPYSLSVEIIENEEEAASRRDLEVRDLRAQEGMNAAAQAMTIATEKMADYAKTSNILVGIGTILLFVTLALTFQANQSARAAVEVTRQIGRAQTVAYPSVEKLELELGERGSDPHRLAVTSYWRNAGNTPAFDFTVEYHLLGYVNGNVVVDRRFKANIEKGMQLLDPGAVEKFHSTPDDFSFTPLQEEMLENRLDVRIEIAGSFRNAFNELTEVGAIFRSAMIYNHPNNAAYGSPYFFNITMVKSPEERGRRNPA